MNQEQWQQIKHLFDSALQQDPAQRDQLLDQTCGNDSVLRSEVVSLLASQSDADSFFDTLEGIRERALEDAFGYLRPGDTVAHYLILEKIGEGGMGQVFKAQDLKLKRTVALKILCADSSQQQETRQRLLREARTAATLHHQNVVTVFSIEETTDADFIVMEYVEGQTLKKKMENGPLAVPELTSLALQICEALEAAHSIGLVHRDIKPENILLNSQEKVKVVDFGLAKKIVSGSAEKDLTGPGIIAGTICYMSPEQVNGRALDHQSDIFSLGSVLYHAATGKLPFEGANVLVTMHAINSEDPVPPSVLRPELPLEFDRILFRALAKSKESRYASLHELAEDLRSVSLQKLSLSNHVILCIEIIDPILRAASLGQQEWHRVGGILRETITKKLREFHGNRVTLDYSGLLARFENPEGALSCATAILRAAEDLKIPVRAALHFDSLNDLDQAFNASVRVCGLGIAGEVLCSSEFRNASASLPISFRDRGSHLLNDSKVPARIFAVAAKEAISREQTVRTDRKFKLPRRWIYLVATLLVIIIAGGFLMRREIAPPISSVAVLPFTSASVNPNVQYVSDAITDNLISQLSQIPTLKVMARGTVFTYKGREVDPRTVGRDLKVDAVVTGSIFQQGDMLIIYADLVRVSDGTVIWGEEHMRKLSDLLTLQQEISKRISQQLHLKLERKGE